MSLIGTAIGALVALLPRPKAVILTWMCPKCGWMNDNNNGPCRKCGAPQAQADKADARFIAGYDAGLKDGRREAKEAQVEVERLTSSHARLVDHIETLEREILLEQHICAHWKEEAERLAKHAIASRLRAETQEQQALQQQYQGLQPMRPADGRQAMAYAQANAALAQQAQHQLANYANQAQALQWRGDYDGFCNCVPSRAQVWAREGDR
jgi:hypothetical protein